MRNPFGWGLPEDISKHGAGIDQLIALIHVFMIVLFIGWAIFLTYTLIRFRERKGHKATYKLGHFQAPTYLEVGIAIFEFVLLLAFATPIWFSVKNNFPSKDKAVQVRVVAQQFAWNIHYPGPDGVFGKTDPKLMDSSNPVGLDVSDPAAKDDVTTINQLHVPVDAPILVTLSSKDVIHSFDLTEMRVKQDVIPGMAMQVWFEAKKTGDFEIACAQLCGFGHYRMKGFFTVETKDKFDAWLVEQGPAAGGISS